MRGVGGGGIDAGPVLRRQGQQQQPGRAHENGARVLAVLVELVDLLEGKASLGVGERGVGAGHTGGFVFDLPVHEVETGFGNARLDRLVGEVEVRCSPGQRRDRALDAGSLAHVALLESQQRYLDRERQYHEVVGPGCDPAVLTAGRQCGDIRWGRLGRRRGRGGGRAKARRRQLEVEVVALEELRERLLDCRGRQRLQRSRRGGPRSRRPGQSRLRRRAVEDVCRQRVDVDPGSLLSGGPRKAAGAEQ